MYAAGETGPAMTSWRPTSRSLLRGVPTLASLDTGLVGGEGQAAVSYALAYRAVADLAQTRSDAWSVATVPVLASVRLARYRRPARIR